jgi:uncharacterized protein with HEPN domain
VSQDATRLIDYLQHMLQAIDRIGRYVESHSEGEFFADELIQDAVIRNFEILGEASRNIEKRHPEFADAHRDLPLLAAYEMRNALAHGYFKVDLEIVWRTIERDLPPLRRQIETILAGMRQ